MSNRINFFPPFSGADVLQILKLTFSDLIVKAYEFFGNSFVTFYFFHGP